MTEDIITISARDIVKIEECMNRLSGLKKYRDQSRFGKFSLDELGDKSPEVDFDRISALMDGLGARKDLDFVYSHLRKRGYVRKDNALNVSLFQEEAMITQSVWSRYENGKQTRTDHYTLIKIILGLRLSEDDANRYLTMTGSSFAIYTDPLDRIVLSFITADYLGKQDTVDIVNTVYALLEYYSQQEVKAGRKPLKKLYDL